MRKHALLVGVEDYRDKMISRLNFARADATALAERLSDRCGFDHVRVLADEGGEDEPLLVNIITALRDTSAELRQDDLFLFFFAGHGVEKDGHGYLLARDSLQAFPEHGSLSLELLRKTFESLAAKRRVLLLDACRNSPQAARSDASNLMTDAVSRDIVAAAQSHAISGTTTSLLSACRSGQRAYEWPAKGHGVFTYYLLDGLGGEAWAGSSLELRALAAYVADHVREWSAKMPGIECLQEPWYEEFGHPSPILIAQGESSRADASSAPFVEASPEPNRCCRACGARIEADWIACPDCGARIAEEHASNAPLVVKDDLYRFRQSIYAARLDCLSKQAEQVQINLGGLSAVLDTQVLLSWLHAISDHMLRTAQWFDFLYWDATNRRLIIRSNYPCNLLQELAIRPFGEGEAKAKIEEGPTKYGSKHYESKSDYLLRVAHLYQGVFGSISNAVQALSRAEQNAEGASGLSRIAVEAYRMSGDRARAIGLIKRAAGRAKETLDFTSVASAASELLMDEGEVRTNLMSAEQRVTDSGDWEYCAAEWFDLLGDIDRAKAAAEKFMSKAEPSSIVHSKGLAERFVLSGNVDFARHILTQEARLGFDSVTPGWHAAELSLIWSDILGDRGQALAVLRQGEDAVRTQDKKVYKKFKSYVGQTSSWSRLARAWLALGESGKARNAASEAQAKAFSDDDRQDAANLLRDIERKKG